MGDDFCPYLPFLLASMSDRLYYCVSSTQLKTQEFDSNLISPTVSIMSYSARGTPRYSSVLGY